MTETGISDLNAKLTTALHEAAEAKLEAKSERERATYVADHWGKLKTEAFDYANLYRRLLKEAAEFVVVGDLKSRIKAALEVE